MNTFQNLSPIKNLTIIKDCDDFIDNKGYLISLDTARVDSLIGRGVIKNIIKVLGKKEEELENANLIHFAISGHTEKNSFASWQLFDKGRYLVKNNRG